MDSSDFFFERAEMSGRSSIYKACENNRIVVMIWVLLRSAIRYLAVAICNSTILVGYQSKYLYIKMKRLTSNRICYFIFIYLLFFGGGGGRGSFMAILVAFARGVYVSNLSFQLQKSRKIDVFQKEISRLSSFTIYVEHILVPRGHDPFGQHQKSTPLATSNFWALAEYSFRRVQPIRFIGSEQWVR